MASGDAVVWQVEHRSLMQIVAALDDGVILVTPGGEIAWANPSALRMHGIRRIEDLGPTVAEYRRRYELRYRNRHSLAAGAYPMERVIAGEAFDEVVVTVAPSGEKEPRWTHRIRSIGLTGVDGAPHTLALIINDETDRYEAEERFERSFAANPAPAVILRLSDLRYVKVNTGFLEMLGYRADAVVGRTVQDLDVLEGAKHREAALEAMRDHRTVPQMEAFPRGADGAPHLVLVAGQPIEMADRKAMLFTFADLEARRAAETALYDSEERFSKAFRVAPVPMLLVELRDDARLALVNEAFSVATGHPARQAVGRTFMDLALFPDGEAAEGMERDLRAGNAVADLPLRVRTREGGLLDALVSSEPVVIKRTPCALLAILDVTERRRTEAELAEALEAVMRDTSWFSRTVLEKLARLRRGGTGGEDLAEGPGSLTRRGQEILSLVCRGLDDARIAETVGLSRTTVRNHVNDLYRRTGARGRTALVVWARERGFAGVEGPGRQGRGRRAK